MAGPTSVSDMYGGIINPGGGLVTGSPIQIAPNPANRSFTSPEFQQMYATYGKGQNPILDAYNTAAPPAPVAGPMPPMPRPRPPYAPNMMDIAGMEKLAALARAAQQPASVTKLYAPRRAAPPPPPPPPPPRMTPVQQRQAQGMSASQAYASANQDARTRAIANSRDPVGNSARAGLASNWGFD